MPGARNASAASPRPTGGNGLRAHFSVAGVNAVRGRGERLRNQGFCLTKTRGTPPDPVQEKGAQTQNASEGQKKPLSRISPPAIDPSTR